MMRALYIVVALAIAWPAWAQGWAPLTGSGNATLSVTTTSARVTLPGAPLAPNTTGLTTPPPTTNVSVCNTGANPAYVIFTVALPAVSTVATGSLVSSGVCRLFTPPTNTTYLAAITSSGSTTLEIETGSGSPLSTITPPLLNSIDARTYGFSASGTGAANGTALQAAINAAYNQNPVGASVYIPLAGTVNGPVYWPKGIKLVGGGVSQKLIAGNDGPLFAVVSVPGGTYPTTQVDSLGCQDLYINGNGHKGTGFLLERAEAAVFINCGAQNYAAGAVFTTTGIVNGTMTVSATTQGTITVGDMVMCSGCATVSGTGGTGAAAQAIITYSAVPAGVAVGALVADSTTAGVIPAATYVKAKTATTVTLTGNITGAGVVSGDTLTFDSNTYPTVVSGSGPYVLSSSINVSGTHAGWTSPPWTRSGGPAVPSYCGSTSVCFNSIFPTAALTLLQGTYQSAFVGGFYGGSYFADDTHGKCGQWTAIGVYMDSIQSDGTGGKPNANRFYDTYSLCANVAMFIANGSDNGIFGSNGQYAGIVLACGTGPAACKNNRLFDFYCEGGTSDGFNVNTCIVFGVLASQNHILGLGSRSLGGGIVLEDNGNNNTVPTDDNIQVGAGNGVFQMGTDTGFSRDGAGGTNVDCGNGVAGNKTCNLNLATLTATAASAQGGAVDVNFIYANPTQTIANSAIVNGVNSSPAYTATSGTLSAFRGLRANPNNASTGTISSLMGVAAFPENVSTGPVTTMYGFYTQPRNDATGTISTLYGLYLDTPTNASGTITTKYGLYQADTASKNVIAGPLTIGTATALTLNNGEIGLPKITASGSAPGAAGLKLATVCGTNAGTAKIIAYAGTSTTPATVLDNIGSGVTGC